MLACACVIGEKQGRERHGGVHAGELGCGARDALAGLPAGSSARVPRAAPAASYCRHCRRRWCRPTLRTEN